MKRQCGTIGNMCNLCCKLMPMTSDSETRRKALAIADELVSMGIVRPGDIKRSMPDFDKPAGKPCPHQRHHKGCKVYKNRPIGCRLWNCRWLSGDDTAELARPDHSHYVIDLAPDFVRRADTGEPIPVVQIWCDPDYPNAHRDSRLRDFMKRRAEEGYQTLIRYNSIESMLITWDGFTFQEHPRVTATTKHHSINDFVRALGLDPSQVKVTFQEK